MKRYSREIVEYVESIVDGRTNEEVAFLTNERYNTAFTAEKIKSFISNHDIKRTVPGKRGIYSSVFPQEVAGYIQENYIGNGPKKMVSLLNEKFETEYTQKQVTAYYKNHHLNSRVDARFKKGHKPHNKGMKGVRYERCEKGWFKKGSEPCNKVPVGSTTVNQDGYHKTKVAEPNKWEFTHKIVWRSHFGEIPKGMMVSFKDGNKANIVPENLMLITPGENAQMNTRGLRSERAEVTEVGLLVAKCYQAAKHRKE